MHILLQSAPVFYGSAHKIQNSVLRHEGRRIGKRMHPFPAKKMPAVEHYAQVLREVEPGACLLFCLPNVKIFCIHRVGLMQHPLLRNSVYIRKILYFDAVGHNKTVCAEKNKPVDEPH